MPSTRTLGQMAIVTVAMMFLAAALSSQSPAVRQVLGR